MDSNSSTQKCINCERTEHQVPLVNIRFAENPTWICTQCLPTLIHEPQRLVNKFKNIDTNNTPEPKIQ